MSLDESEFKKSVRKESPNFLNLENNHNMKLLEDCSYVIKKEKEKSSSSPDSVSSPSDNDL